MRAPKPPPLAIRTTLTREGRLAAIVAFGIALAAVNTGNNLLYLLLGWLVAFMIASLILAQRTLSCLDVSREAPAQVGCFMPFAVTLELRNTTRRRAAYALELTDIIDGQPCDKQTYVVAIGPGEAVRRSYLHAFCERGEHAFEAVRIATQFPFALFRKERTIACAHATLAQPAQLSVVPPTLPAPKPGEAASLELGRGGEFHALRERRHGDELRAIHWKAVARTGRLMVREYERDQARRVTLYVDHAIADVPRPRAVDLTPREHAARAASDQAVALASSLLAAWHQQHYRIALVTPEQHLAEGHGANHLAALQRALASLPPRQASRPLHASGAGARVMVQAALPQPSLRVLGAGGPR